MSEKSEFKKRLDVAHLANGFLNPSEVEKAVADCLQDLLNGQPELSPQTLRWLKKWWGFNINAHTTESCSIGTKIVAKR